MNIKLPYCSLITMLKLYYQLPIHLVVGLFFVYDLWMDYLGRTLNAHFYLELLLFVAIFYLVIRQFNQIRQHKEKLFQATNTIKKLQGEMAHYIDQEFTKWQLTNAENAVAWLIIKGFSFKEIAQLRQVSEKTISQQSATIYKKSGYNNRHELMSAFLEEFVNFSV